jgi:hypothetical protein
VAGPGLVLATGVAGTLAAVVLSKSDPTAAPWTI